MERRAPRLDGCGVTVLPKPVRQARAHKPLKRHAKLQRLRNMALSVAIETQGTSPKAPFLARKAIKRRKRPARVRKTPLGQLAKRLDIMFSAYVKARDGNVCITCGATCAPGNLNAGHFVSRRVQSVRWDPKNAHSQCAVPCNFHRRGAPAEYALAILDRYGAPELRRLLARKLVQKRWTRPELETLINALGRSGADFEATYYESYF